MAVDGSSAWRRIGDLTPAQFRQGIPANSPLLPEIDAIYQAVKGYSALYKAHLEHENSFATTGEALNVADHNAQGSKDHQNGGYMSFPSWTAGAAWWKQHVTDPQGYYANVVTIADYVHTYAPWQDGNDEGAYVAVICTYANQVQGGNVVTAARGHVPQPPWISRYDIGNNHNIGQGRSDDYPHRRANIKGSCVHTSQGYFSGNLQVFSDPTFGGLTDAQIGGPWDGQYDGVIMVFIDPDGNVVPWANGGIGPNCQGCVPPHGDGPAYLNTFGASDITVNAWLRSVETTDGGDPTVAKGGKQIESLCFLLAYWHSEHAGQSWDQFAWRMSHWEFGGEHQQCPGDWIKANEQYINDRTVAIMKAYQTNTRLQVPLVITYPPGYSGPQIPQPGETGAPVTAPPPPPAPAYVAGSKPSFWDTLVAQGYYVDQNGFTWFTTTNTYTVKTATSRWTHADPTGTRTGPDMAPDDEINPNGNVIAVGTSASDKKQWVIDPPYWSRFQLDALTLKTS